MDWTLIDWTAIGVRVLQMALIVLAAFLLDRVVSRQIGTVHHLRRVPRDLMRKATGLVRVALYAVAIFIALMVSDLPLSKLLTSLGVVAILTAFLANQVLSNLIAGVIIVIDNPFGVGDLLEFGGLPGTTQGPYRVMNIGLRTTRLLGRAGEIIIVPNQWFLVNPFVNRSFADIDGAPDESRSGRGAPSG